MGQLIKRLTNQGYNLQVMAANGLKGFLASERAREEAERLEFERQQREKDRILRRIVDKNARMVSAGYNKLIEEWKVKQNTLKDKLKFIIKALTDKDASYILAGYNGLKQRALMLNGVGMGDAAMKKIQLIKRLTNQGYNLQVMAANALQEFLASERAREEAERLEYERLQKEKDRILRRIMDGNVRLMGTGFRQAFQWMEADREAEINRMKRQRGIMRRIVDSNTRLMSAGYNKLLEEWKARNINLKDKLKFVIKSLTDKDASYTMMAYNGLKQRALMLLGVGLGDDKSQLLKIRLIRRITNQGYNLQCMPVNSLIEYLKSERER